ncbi:hypothetical protein EA72_00545 [Enterococcus faecium]|nr:hypothetical protein CUS87_03355 [Enterococcus faecium]RBT16623.1 hypothetical protein EA95_01117 [Enterococcus faecium]RBT28532.1 hypothetical protein EA72_00545 [Enterococcus faecium]RBT31824.1 hypothetical protein EB01_01756 [Enterococcus faecium]
MKKYLVILSLIFLTTCKNHNEDISSISTSTVESQQTSNPLEIKVNNQITTTTPDELLGDWKVNNKGFGIEVLEEQVVFYIGDFHVVSYVVTRLFFL